MVGRIGFALAVFVVFGGLTWVMGRSVARDFEDARRERDRLSVFTGIEGLVPVTIAGLIAVICPILILLSG